MGIEVRLLGPVEVWAGARMVPAGESRRRAVLAVLAASAGSVVGQDALVDRVWGEQPPRCAADTLRSYVTRLRRVLDQAAAGDQAPPRIVRQAGGYRLDIAPERVDLHRFRGLVTAAREPERTDEERVDLLRAAVALWRGLPLTGVPGDWAARTGQTWQQERWQAMAAWAHAELRVGNPEAVLAPLTELAVEHPEVEPLTAALMRALAAVGRPTDALLVCDQHRRRLAEEYGTDQGPQLQALYTAILRGDEQPSPAADPPPAPAAQAPAGSGRQAAAAAPVRPAQLPSDVPVFTGRAEHLSQLDALLDGSARGASTAVVISAVSGTAGVGKTALAVHWAHRAADRFPDGQLYVNLRGFGPSGQVMTTAEAVRGFLDALDVAPQRIPPTVDAQTALYRSLLAGRRMLIVLDNARDAGQVRPLLPGTATCFVVVTSRNRLSGLTASGAEPVTLDLLTPAESHELLTARLGADRVAAEPRAVSAIVAACSRLPLALNVVAARARQTGFALASIAAELAEAGDRLDALDGGDPASQVRAVFSWSYTALTAPAARLFRLLGLHPGPQISTAATASLAGEPATAVRPLLFELVHANLLAEPVPGRYACHDLLRAYAADLTAAHDPPERRRSAATRMLDHYVHTVHAADRHLHPHRGSAPVPLAPPAAGTAPERPVDVGRATAWLTAEHPILMAVLRQAADAGFDAQAWHLSWALDTFHDRQGLWHDGAAAGEVALRAARRLGDPLAQAASHRLLARACTPLRRYSHAQAHYQHALDLYGAACDRVGQADVHRSLGILGCRQRHYEQALHHTQQALATYRAVGHSRGQANALNDVGWCHALLGDYQETLDHCEQALVLLQRLGDRTGQAATWDSLGYAHHHLGRHDRAVACYRHALDLYRQDGYRLYQAIILGHLGDAHLAAGDRDAARTAWIEAADVFAGLEHPDAADVRAKLRDLDATAQVTAPAGDQAPPPAPR